MRLYSKNILHNTSKESYLSQCSIIAVTGTDLVAESGINCMQDFVIVPDPRENGVATNTDRFCGNGFVTKTCK